MSTFFEGNDISFIFFDGISSQLLIYRDLFGKRSLILSYSDQDLMLSSVRLFAGPSFEILPSSLLALPLSDKTPFYFKRCEVTPSMIRFGPKVPSLIFDKELRSLQIKNDIMLLLL